MRRLMTLLLLAGCAATPEGGAGRSTLVVVGGGGTPQVVLKRTLGLAGGEEVDVAVLPYASGRENRGDGAVDMWLDAGAARARNVEDLEHEDAVRALLEADVIWMIGGDQNRLVGSLTENGLGEVLARRWRSGGVFGGTSAGAAVMSARMITGDADLESLRSEATVTAGGLGLWSGVIVDQHFVARRRNTRLLSAVLDVPDEVGVGIDERTAVVVHPGGACEVVGEGSVLVYDARDAQVAPTTPGAHWGARGITLHVLRDGDRFDLR